METEGVVTEHKDVRWELVRVLQKEIRHPDYEAARIGRVVDRLHSLFSSDQLTARLPLRLVKDQSRFWFKDCFMAQQVVAFKRRVSKTRERASRSPEAKKTPVLNGEPLERKLKQSFCVLVDGKEVQVQVFKLGEGIYGHGKDKAPYACLRLFVPNGAEITVTCGASSTSWEKPKEEGRVGYVRVPGGYSLSIYQDAERLGYIRVEVPRDGSRAVFRWF